MNLWIGDKIGQLARTTCKSHRTYIQKKIMDPLSKTEVCLILTIHRGLTHVHNMQQNETMADGPLLANGILKGTMI